MSVYCGVYNIYKNMSRFALTEHSIRLVHLARFTVGKEMKYNQTVNEPNTPGSLNGHKPCLVASFEHIPLMPLVLMFLC